MKVAVVGGGVIGLCAAEALARRGAEVVVFEAHECGAAASAGNAGWVTPGLSAPLCAPGTVSRALRWMASPDSPLHIRPRARLSFGRWCYDFWRSSTPRRYRAGMAALVALSDRTIEGYDALAERGVEFEMHADGLLCVGRTELALTAELAELHEQRSHGYRGELERLDRDEALALEPGLADGIAGAILASGERHVRPESLTAGLVRHLAGIGVEIREQTCVQRLSREPNCWRLHGDDGDAQRAERVVVATGVACADLLRPLGVDVPLEGGKGYSITVDDPPVRLSRPLYLLEPRVAVSPFEGSLRIAGKLELGARDLRLEERRFESIDRAGQGYLRGWRSDTRHRRWAGFRPLLPDALPAIGPIPSQPGLFVATGHGILGVTLAPATAEMLAPAVLDGRPSAALAPFSVARFTH